MEVLSPQGQEEDFIGWWNISSIILGEEYTTMLKLNLFYKKSPVLLRYNLHTLLKCADWVYFKWHLNL